jgi:hypothetical protein
MVARYIPSLVVIGVALAAYRLLGVDEMFQKLIEPKALAESYDYIVGEQALYRIGVHSAIIGITMMMMMMMEHGTARNCGSAEMAVLRNKGLRSPHRNALCMCTAVWIIGLGIRAMQFGKRIQSY